MFKSWAQFPGSNPTCQNQNPVEFRYFFYSNPIYLSNHHPNTNLFSAVSRVALTQLYVGPNTNRAHVYTTPLVNVSRFSRPHSFPKTICLKADKVYSFSCALPVWKISQSEAMGSSPFIKLICLWECGQRPVCIQFLVNTTTHICTSSSMRFSSLPWICHTQSCPLE